jgi:hypothetical protein
MTPINFVKIVFQNFSHVKAPEVVFSPDVSIFANKYQILIKLILSMRGTMFSLFNLVLRILSV